MKKTIKISGMHCMNCVNRVDKALTALGCKSKIDLKKGIATIENTDISDTDLKNAIEDLGFDVVSID
jgi:copper chaperone